MASGENRAVEMQSEVPARLGHEVVVICPGSRRERALRLPPQGRIEGRSRHRAESARSHRSLGAGHRARSQPVPEHRHPMAQALQRARCRVHSQLPAHVRCRAPASRRRHVHAVPGWRPSGIAAPPLPRDERWVAVGRLQPEKGLLDLVGRLPAYNGLVFPSRWMGGEATIVLDSLAAGLPSVYFTGSSAADSTQGSGAGFEVAEFSEDSWRSTLDRVIDAGEGARTAARGRYEERHSTSSWERRMVGIYQGVIEREAAR
jgi:hypothetical protein